MTGDLTSNVQSHLSLYHLLLPTFPHPTHSGLFQCIGPSLSTIPHAFQSSYLPESPPSSHRLSYPLTRSVCLPVSVSLPKIVNPLKRSPTSCLPHTKPPSLPSLHRRKGLSQPSVNPHQDSTPSVLVSTQSLPPDIDKKIPILPPFPVLTSDPWSIFFFCEV